MLLQEKMKNTKFSPSEEIVIDFILTKQERIKDYSTTMIAGEHILHHRYWLEFLKN